MITPVFSITQDDNVLVITIRAPYANVKDTEIEYDGRMFVFSSTPYFLRLHLTGDVENNDDSSAQYHTDQGTFEVRVPKKRKGDHFPSLDMITELLRPQNTLTANRPIEEIDDTHEGDEFVVEQKEGSLDVEPLEEVSSVYGYGFGWTRHGVLGKLSTEIEHLVDIEHADDSPIDKRCEACSAFDQLSFQPDHYIGDLMEENDQLNSCLRFEFAASCFDMCSQDREFLKDLPRRKLPQLNEERTRQVALSLIDILFSYLYDLRTNHDEHSVESGWTIAKLSASLCYLVRWSCAKEALIGAVRRSLCYPLYRHWQLAIQLVNDLKSILNKGRTAIVHCLVDISRELSTSGDFRYLLNDLYMTDYCIWIQSCDDAVIPWLSAEVHKVELHKSDLQLELEEIELEAQMRAMNVTDNKEVLDSDDDQS